MAEPETFALIHCNVLFHVCVKKQKTVILSNVGSIMPYFPSSLSLQQVILFWKSKDGSVFNCISLNAIMLKRFKKMYKSLLVREN